MFVVTACCLAMAAGVALAFRWRGYRFGPPMWAASDQNPSALRRTQGLVWMLSVGALTGILVGALVVGPGARLAMRLLAATSPQAQGRITEADQVIGNITASGTLGILIFVGLPAGVAVAVTYVLAAFGLPPGATGGALYGLVVLVVFASRLDPLRAENPDFDIVGPGWLSVLTFTTLAVITGATVACFSGRLAAALPPPRPWWTLWLVPLSFLTIMSLVLGEPWLAAAVVVGGAVYVLAGPLSRSRPMLERSGVLAMRALLAAIALTALPGFASAAFEIVT